VPSGYVCTGYVECTVNVPVWKDITREYTVMVPHEVEKVVPVCCVKMVPKTIKVPVCCPPLSCKERCGRAC